ncbi:hypothetical protein [Rhizobium leucaenae]|uniref:hypothetical protein n=1 Tax=Rhizobium leucaenae TaxID=29450 RepID=UPI0007EE4BE9|nr:hypothetical protein [Rhizobium leucaenae]
MAKHHYTYAIDGIDDTFDFTSVFLPSATGWLAEEAGKDFFDNHDGWEWKWPAKVTVYNGDVALGTFSVELEHVASFSAYEVAA